MTETTIPVSEAIDDALDFARGAWREAFAPMAVTALGWLLIVVGGHAQITPEAAGLCTEFGWALQLFYLPLLGALYRLAVGGAAYRGLGPGGLQLGGVEARVLTVNAVLCLFCLLATLPVIVLSGIFFMLLHRIGNVTLGPAGPWAWWFLVSAVFWAVLLGWLSYMCGRLALATPLSVDRRRVLPFTGWPLTEGRGRTIALAFVLAHAPTLIAVLGLTAFGWVEPADVPVGLHGPWPLLDTIGAGAVAGMLLSGLQAPLSVGLLTFFYDVLAPAHDDHASAPVADREPAPAPAPPAAMEAAPDADPAAPFSRVEYAADKGRFFRVFAPWLAHEPVPESYARFGEGAPPAPRPEPDGDGDYPRSIVEYSPHTGRFSRLFSPWLAGEPPPPSADERATQGAEPPVGPQAEPLHPPALDGAGEAEHPEP